MTSLDSHNLTLFRVGGAVTISHGDLVDWLEAARRRVVSPFAGQRLSVVARVSEKLLGREGRATAPFIKQFAFWTRRAALAKLATSFERRLPPQTRAVPRGLVFHLPPQNVETVLLYSWILSYLVGNANVTRVPTNVSDPIRTVCDLFLDQLQQAGDSSQLFVHYDATSALNGVISALSDARVVWGGDGKIAIFTILPLRNGGKSLWFGDRSSFTVVKGDALAQLDDGSRDAVAHRLFNDVFTFDQMACSSPHLLFVVGDPERDGKHVASLLAAVADFASAQGHRTETSHYIRKIVSAYRAAANGDASAIEWRNAALTTVVSSRVERPDIRLGGGFLWIDFVSSIEDLKAVAKDRDQTITHFGFSTDEISEIANAVAGSGVSRLAPVGSALDFDAVWDGYDIPFELTRLVRVT